SGRRRWLNLPATLAKTIVEEKAEQRNATSVWLQVASRLDPRFGGLSAAVPALAQASERAGAHVAPLAVFGAPTDDLTHIAARGLSAFRFPQGRCRWMIEKHLQPELRELVESCDGVHIHGIWEEYCSIASHQAQVAGKPYLVAAHGMLEG